MRYAPSNDVVHVSSAERLNETMNIDDFSLNEVETEDIVHGFCGKIIFIDKEKRKRCIGHMLKEDGDDMCTFADSRQRHTMVKPKFSAQNRKREQCKVDSYKHCVEECYPIRIAVHKSWRVSNFKISSSRYCAKKEFT